MTFEIFYELDRQNFLCKWVNLSASHCFVSIIHHTSWRTLRYIIQSTHVQPRIATPFGSFCMVGIQFVSCKHTAFFARRSQTI